MKKAIREWAFNLFTKRITIKIAKLSDNDRIEFLANNLMNELISQGHDISGISEGSEYLSIFSLGEVLRVEPHSVRLEFKRTK